MNTTAEIPSAALLEKNPIGGKTFPMIKCILLLADEDRYYTEARKRGAHAYRTADSGYRAISSGGAP